MGHALQYPPSMYVLAMHMQSEALLDPALEVWPRGHNLQEIPSLYWLAGHLQA